MVKLNMLSDKAGARQDRMRVGRGIGSGKGKTAGRGHKGQKSRSGVAIKGFEGGQMPLYQRLPKRGFNNVSRKQYACINLAILEKAFADKKLSAAKPISEEVLLAAGVLKKKSADGIKILGVGVLTVKAEFHIAKVSASAQKAIEDVGGSVVLSPPSPEGTGKRAVRKKQAQEKWQARRAGNDKRDSA